MVQEYSSCDKRSIKNLSTGTVVEQKLSTTRDERPMEIDNMTIRNEQHRNRMIGPYILFLQHLVASTGSLSPCCLTEVSGRKRTTTVYVVDKSWHQVRKGPEWVATLSGAHNGVQVVEQPSHQVILRTNLDQVGWTNRKVVMDLHTKMETSQVVDYDIMTLI